MNQATLPAVEQRTPPITVHLGKYTKRQLRKLDRGEGKVFDEVQAALEEVKVRLGSEANTKVLLPIVVIYKKKNKSREWLR